MRQPDLEAPACNPYPIKDGAFNRNVSLPYGLTTEHVRRAMHEFVEFIGFINQQLRTRNLPRLEAVLMPANYSSVVSEFMCTAIPKYCPTLARNAYHNGHPDLIPKGQFPGDSAQHADVGIELKGSRYLKGWQGHNPEDTWLMVFVFDSNRPADRAKGIPPKPFRFLRVVGARLAKDDWKFSGRSETSRRTITATVLPSGSEKMLKNWIYIDDDVAIVPGEEPLEEAQL